jgi:molybdate transport system ATP-binding protein
MADGLHAVLAQDAPIQLAAEIVCAPGEVLALVGPSGSGKSTVLRCLAGLYTPKSGHIVCAGETWLDSAAGICLPPARRRIGMVFQSYALFPHLTALENVLEGMDDPDSPASRGRGLELLAKVHLDGLEARRPRQLSGGQQQRVALARALAREPHVLLLDEPFSAVDRATRERLYGELAELRRELAMPVVLVTHDLDEAVILADRLTLLAQGRSIQSGPPLEVMQQPASLEAARLAGVENCFEARVIAHCLDGAYTLLAWNGIEIKARLQTAFPVGSKVAWAIPSAGVLLASRTPGRPQNDLAPSGGGSEGVPEPGAHPMPRNRPPQGGLDHPLEGRVTRMLRLADRVRLRVRVAGEREVTLSMSAPRHLAERYDLAEEKTIPLRLRGEHIHLMPAEDIGEPPQ